MGQTTLEISRQRLHGNRAFRSGMVVGREFCIYYEDVRNDKYNENFIITIP